MEIRFCFRIEAAADMAYDTETGENVPAYSQVKLNGTKRLPKDAYDKAHIEIGRGLAAEFNLDPAHVTPISEEEYEANAGDDEDEDGDA